MLAIGYLKKDSAGKILLNEKSYSRKNIIDNLKLIEKHRIVELLEKWHTENAEKADAAMDMDKEDIPEEELEEEPEAEK